MAADTTKVSPHQDTDLDVNVKQDLVVQEHQIQRQSDMKEFNSEFASLNIKSSEAASHNAPGVDSGLGSNGPDLEEKELRANCAQSVQKTALSQQLPLCPNSQACQGFGSNGPDLEQEEVSANGAPLVKKTALSQQLPLFPNSQACVARTQELKSKTIEVSRANVCTESLPCYMEDSVSARLNSKQEEKLIRKDSMPTQAPLTETKPKESSSSLPELNHEQRLMYGQDCDGDNQLMIAADQKNERATQYIISKKPNRVYLDLRNNSYQTALHIAVGNTLYLTTAVLVENGASLNFYDHEGNTPLHIAAVQGDCRMLAILIQYGTQCGRRETHNAVTALLDTKNYEGFTCFHLAVWSGNAEAIHYLTRFGINVNAKDGKSGRTALHHAVEGGNIQLVKYLLEVIKVSVNEETYSNTTALALAKGRNLTDIAELLVQHGGVAYDSSDDDSGNESPMDECV